ncbi:hypothetical protein L0152_00400, partial [bacterium]|nr:hypothetical protein [bacterium]
LENGSFFGYGKVSYTRQNLNINFFANILDAAATNLFSTDENGNLILRNDDSESYNLDASHSKRVVERHNLTYGINFRYSGYDLD